MLKVLIADDERRSREGLRSVIDWDDLDMEVAHCAKDGKEALDFINNNEIDILITDIRMPEMDGIELIKNIAIANKDISIIILSGYGDFSYAQKAIRYGVSNYLLKPVHLDELTDILRSIKEKHKEGVSRVYVEDSEKKRYDEQQKENVDGQIAAMIECIKSGNKEEAMSISAKIYETIKSEDYPLAMYKQVVLKCINRMNMAIQSDLNYELTYFNDTERLMDITIAKEFDDIKGKIDAFIAELCEYMNKVNSENRGSLVYMLKKIVDERYSDSKMTLNDLSEELEVTPNYLGRLFKEEMGVQFSDYLEQLRMENAKKLLKSTNLKIYEIADDCGYNDGQYFAKAFKKYTGMTPLEYKKN